MNRTRRPPESPAAGPEEPMADEDLLPVSGLAHLLYCERRGYLVHAEGLWAESAATVDGGFLHRKAHDPDQEENRAGVAVRRGLPLRSLRLGLTGVADVVELLPDPDGALVPGIPGPRRPFPVEYKRGRLRREPGYLVQLCAQAQCLEEMLGAKVPDGALYFGKARRRLDVAFDEALRRRTADAARRLREVLAAPCAPPAQPGPRCKECSLRDLCLPETTSGGRSAARYLARAFERLREEE
jgi:CRISPR-associated exonuclease Cas4